MHIQEEIRDDVAVMSINGDVMGGPDVASFRDHITRLIGAGITKVVIDFSGVKWFESSMLGMLTACLTMLRNAGGDLRLAGITEKIEEILRVTQLAGVFRTLDTVDRAVASFKTEPPGARV